MTGSIILGLLILVPLRALGRRAANEDLMLQRMSASLMCIAILIGSVHLLGGGLPPPFVYGMAVLVGISALCSAISLPMSIRRSRRMTP